MHAVLTDMVNTPDAIAPQTNTKKRLCQSLKMKWNENILLKWPFDMLKTLKLSHQQKKKLLLLHQCTISTVVKCTVGNYAHQTQRQATKLRPTSCQNDNFKNSVDGENPNEPLAVRSETRQKFVKYQ